jgi:hypothetical protein
MREARSTAEVRYMALEMRRTLGRVDSSLKAQGPEEGSAGAGAWAAGGAAAAAEGGVVAAAAAAAAAGVGAAAGAGVTGSPSSSSGLGSGVSSCCSCSFSRGCCFCCFSGVSLKRASGRTGVAVSIAFFSSFQERRSSFVGDGVVARGVFSLSVWGGRCVVSLFWLGRRVVYV